MITDDVYKDIPYEYIKGEPIPEGITKEDWEQIQIKSLDLFNYLRRTNYHLPDTGPTNAIIVMSLLKGIAPFIGLLSVNLPTKEKGIMYKLIVEELEARLNALLLACKERDSLV